MKAEKHVHFYLKHHLYIFFSSYLFPNVVCRSVHIPDAKNIVLISWPLATSLLSIPRGPAKIKGTATVDPNIVR